MQRGTAFGQGAGMVRPRPAAEPPPWREASIVFAIFIAAQVLDGVLTYVGVSLLGIEIEANILLATWMEVIGAPAALAGAKVLACGCGCVLYCTAWHRPLAITAGLCLGVAVVPWCVVLADVLFMR